MKRPIQPRMVRGAGFEPARGTYGSLYPPFDSSDGLKLFEEFCLIDKNLTSKVVRGHLKHIIRYYDIS